jgi:hypothetical protein
LAIAPQADPKVRLCDRRVRVHDRRVRRHDRGLAATVVDPVRFRFRNAGRIAIAQELRTLRGDTAIGAGFHAARVFA